MQQGRDVGTQYRSAIYYTDDDQRNVARRAHSKLDSKLPKGVIVRTEIKRLDTFYYAEKYHQQYLHKNPDTNTQGLSTCGYMIHVDDLESTTLDTVYS